MFGKKLTKAQILEAEDSKPVEVDVPEWGGSLYIRAMNAVERDRYTVWGASPKHQITEDGEINAGMVTAMTLRLLSLTICDETGALLFNEADIAVLATKSGQVVDRIFQVAQQVNGIGTRVIAEIGKNSVPSPSANSHSV